MLYKERPQGLYQGLGHRDQKLRICGIQLWALGVPFIENHMAKKMEHEMVTGMI